ncbi:hypothetical protein EV426DRAFT_715555 [Tirmania nivea]|nr:hypothetical protein EV426DRAFT_715555 [Tirmania nivea]
MKSSSRTTTIPTITPRTITLRTIITVTMKTTKRRRALTIWEIKMMCQKREEPEHAKEKLSDFGKHFLDEQDLPVPISTLSDILKEKDKWLNFEFASGGTWKKKQRYCYRIFTTPTLFHTPSHALFMKNSGNATDATTTTPPPAANHPATTLHAGILTTPPHSAPTLQIPALDLPTLKIHSQTRHQQRYPPRQPPHKPTTTCGIFLTLTHIT